MRIGSVSNRGSSTLAGVEHRQRCRAPAPRPGPHSTLKSEAPDRCSKRTVRSWLVACQARRSFGRRSRNGAQGVAALGCQHAASRYQPVVAALKFRFRQKILLITVWDLCPR